MSKNIKEIGKELLGKSLNSFHRKTGLTQLEKNNEMQDGILDGILSQVDDAYIEKTEQSNVIHLDGSSDGVVVLDSIEGNTMVNCINRIPFNTTPTTTPNTVYCNNDGYITVNAKEGTYTNAFISKDYCNLKPNTKYTLIIEVVENTLSGGFLVGEEYRSDICTRFDFILSAKQTGIFKIVSTTKDGEDFTNGQYALRSFAFNTNNLDGEKIKYRVFILEGDYSNVEVNYFEGLQSSFEEKTNEQGKYEIEILSHNKNLFKVVTTSKKVHSSGITVIWNKEEQSFTLNGTTSNDFYMYGEDNVNSVNPYWIDCKKTDEKISVSVQHEGGYNINNNDDEILYLGFANGTYGRLYGSSGKFIMTQNGILTSDVEKPWMRIKGGTTFNNFKVKIQFEKSNNVTSYAPYTSNKIKVLINEPLRSGVTKKDNLCVIDNKLYIERNTKQLIFDGSRNWLISYGHENICHARLPQSVIGKDIDLTVQNSKIKGYCDKLSLREHGIWNQDIEGIHTNNSPNFDNRALFINIKQTTVGGNTSEILKTYLSNNPIKLVIETYEPVYEEVVNEYGEPIILEGYENGTLYIDSTVIPTTTVRYTPKMESFKTLKEVNKNNNLITLDINENIIPYMMDVDYMIMEKELCLLNTKNIRKMEELDMTSMQKRTQDMLERLIKGKTLTEQECKTRVTTYLNAGKITDEQAEELMLVISEVYA